MDNSLLGSGIVDHAAPHEASARLMRRLASHWSVPALVGILGTLALTALLGYFDHVQQAYRSGGTPVAQERQIYRDEIARLQMRIADLESWDCTEIKPQHRLTAKRYRWCQQEVNER